MTGLLTKTSLARWHSCLCRVFSFFYLRYRPRPCSLMAILQAISTSLLYSIYLWGGEVYSHFISYPFPLKDSPPSCYLPSFSDLRPLYILGDIGNAYRLFLLYLLSVTSFYDPPPVEISICLAIHRPLCLVEEALLSWHLKTRLFVGGSVNFLSPST